MDYLLICITAILASGLTLFSGFGLGTIMLPVFAYFFPLEMAIALTAIVHFLNNVFKTGLMGKHIDWKITLRFGIPAFIMAFAGAELLDQFGNSDVLFRFDLWGRERIITPITLTISVLIGIFAIFDILPSNSKLNLGPKYLVPGGMLSGFFGGLSGHQGALRSVFLIKAGMNKEGFIATGIVIACLVDTSRMISYLKSGFFQLEEVSMGLMTAATLSAFLGAFLGKKVLKKITLRTVQILVGVLLIVFALAMGLDLLPKK